MDGDARRDGDGQDLGEAKRTDHAADGANTVDGALELALRCRIDAAGHQGLHGWASNAPEAEEGNGTEEHPAAWCESEAEETEHAKGESGEDTTAFAETADERADEDSGNDAGADADDGEGQADVAFGPSVAILRVEHEDGGEGLLGEVEERHDAGEAEELRMRAEECEGAERVGHVPGGFGAAFLRKGFGKHEKTIGGIG